MKKSNKLLVILGSVVFLLIIIVVIGKKQGWIGSGKATKVVTEKVENKTITETVSASGKIFPEVEVKISSDVSGEIVELHIVEGDSVSIGDKLLKINPDIYLSSVERAAAALNNAKANLANTRARATQVKAQYEKAEQDFNRNKKLYDKEVISASDFEASETSWKSAKADLEAAMQSVIAAEFTVKSAEASLKEARDNLQRTTIYAPINGIVSSLNVESGERVVGTAQMTGTEILRIADLGKMEVRVDVSENDILRVNVGDMANIEVDAYLDKKFKGMVTQIAHSAQSTAAGQLTSEQVTNFTVKIRILKESYDQLISMTENYPFRPGMSASVEIETETAENVPAVPIQSVTTRKKEKSKDRNEEEASDKNVKKNNPDDEELQEIVFVFDPEKQQVKTVEVETGIQNATHIQITSGLTQGQEVVTAPYSAISRKLEDGDTVEKTEMDNIFEGMED